MCTQGEYHVKTMITGWDEAIRSQGMPKMARNPATRGKAQADFEPNTLICNFQHPELLANKFPLLKPHSL
jgi:hypothetical protein